MVPEGHLSDEGYGIRPESNRLHGSVENHWSLMRSIIHKDLFAVERELAKSLAETAASLGTHQKSR